MCTSKSKAVSSENYVGKPSTHARNHATKGLEFFFSDISVMAKTRESSGSKKTICWFAIFSELIIVPPNLTESDSVNFDGANLIFIVLQSFINFWTAPYDSMGRPSILKSLSDI